jgi:hypothetical protein
MLAAAVMLLNGAAVAQGRRAEVIDPVACAKACATYVPFTFSQAFAIALVGIGVLFTVFIRFGGK